MHARFVRLRAFAENCDADAAKEIAASLGAGDEAAVALAQAIGAAYPALRGLALRRFDALQSIAKEGWRQARKRSEILRRFHVACGALGDAGLRPFDAFGRIARRLVSTIEEHDDDGFCARMDLRLRPEGGSGPITNSIAAAVGYYETFGVGWERAALVRARPVAGDLDVGERLLRELAPFVYRRTVDPAVALEMHEMARRARIEL